ncbi:MAG TPA: hypothetical protein VI893_01910 [Thermoplasmata archaeon]|nr:hypothetical protein [Thermoplasmata archaeon]
MRLYVKFYFNSEGGSPLETIKKMKSIGFQPEVGDYDASAAIPDPQNYATLVTKLHDLLKGSNVGFTLTTK